MSERAFDFVEMKVPSKAEYVGVIRLSVSGIANRMGFTYEAIEDIKVAISEAVTNVVTHAYEDEDIGEVAIGFGIYEDKIEIMVSDKGDSFEFEKIRSRIGPVMRREKINPQEELREGGFGLFLIDALMDEVEINNEHGVIVLMTKYLSESEVELRDQVPSNL